MYSLSNSLFNSMDPWEQRLLEYSLGFADERTEMPQSESSSSSVMNFPPSPTLDSHDQDRVISPNVISHATVPTTLFKTTLSGTTLADTSIESVTCKLEAQEKTLEGSSLPMENGKKRRVSCLSEEKRNATQLLRKEHNRRASQHYRKKVKEELTGLRELKNEIAVLLTDYPKTVPVLENASNSATGSANNPKDLAQGVSQVLIQSIWDKQMVNTQAKKIAELEAEIKKLRS